MRVVGITGVKGGIGKSTTAIHLASFLADRGGRVVLVDSDPNRTALNWSRRGCLPCEVVDDRQAFRVVPGADYVVVDTPARPDTDDLAELVKGADLLVLPTVPDIVSLEPMLQMVSDLASVLGTDQVAGRYRILITMAPPRPNRDGQRMRVELQQAGAPVFRAIIRQAVGFKKAALAGVPVSRLTGRDRLGWLDYEAMGKEVLEILENV